MTRRDLIALLGSTAATWPVGVRAQQKERVRRIGILMNVSASDPEAQSHMEAFRQGLQALGWIEGRNIHLETRWALPIQCSSANMQGSLSPFPQN
jgi:putative tryptophan/tyrosine transport system substrate-binding protein